MKPLDAAELRAVLEESALSPALTAQILATLDKADSEFVEALAYERDLSSTVNTALHAERAAHEATRAELARLLLAHDSALAEAESLRSELAAVSGNLALALEGHANELDEMREARDAEWLKAAQWRDATQAERAKVARLREALVRWQRVVDSVDQGPRSDPSWEWRIPWTNEVASVATETASALAETAPDAPALLAPQPPPTRDARSEEVWPAVLAKYGDAMGPKLRALCEARNLQGIAKYGVALTTFNGRDAKTDALQEKIDGIAYDGQDELTEESLEPRSRLALMAEERVYRSILAAADVMCAQHIAAERDAKGGGQ